MLLRFRSSFSELQCASNWFPLEVLQSDMAFLTWILLFYKLLVNYNYAQIRQYTHLTYNPQ